MLKHFEERRDAAQFLAAMDRWKEGDPFTCEAQLRSCLLYTSDAADERSSVDLGGRRIIKKKKKILIKVGCN